MRPRSSASATSWSGASGTAESATTVAQRRTARVPSSVSASRTVSIWRGSAKKAELTWRSSPTESPTSAPMMRSSSSKEVRPAVSSPSACSEASAPAPPPSPRGRAKNSPWKWEKPSTRQRRELLGRGDAGGHELEPARGRLGDQRAQLLVLAPGTRTLTIAAVLEQRLVALEVVGASVEAGPWRSARGPLGAVPAGSWSTAARAAAPGMPAGGASSQTAGRRRAPAARRARSRRARCRRRQLVGRRPRRPSTTGERTIATPGRPAARAPAGALGVRSRSIPCQPASRPSPSRTRDRARLHRDRQLPSAWLRRTTPDQPSAAARRSSGWVRSASGRPTSPRGRAAPRPPGWRTSACRPVAGPDPVRRGVDSAR